MIPQTTAIMVGTMVGGTVAVTGIIITFLVPGRRFLLSWLPRRTLLSILIMIMGPIISKVMVATLLPWFWSGPVRSCRLKVPPLFLRDLIFIIITQVFLIFKTLLLETTRRLTCLKVLPRFIRLKATLLLIEAVRNITSPVVFITSFIMKVICRRPEPPTLEGVSGSYDLR